MKLLSELDSLDNVKDGITRKLPTKTSDLTNDSITLSSFGITATASEINKVDGLTPTTTELNFVDGVTSSIQTQINNKITFDEVIMNENVFGGKKLYNSLLNNALYVANFGYLDFDGSFKFQFLF